MNIKAFSNVLALAAAALKGEKINAPPQAMAELWNDVAQAGAEIDAARAQAAPAPAADGDPGNGG